MCSNLFNYVGVYRHRRIPATHVFVILISADDRKCKPYALPVQMIPYVGMGHDKIRSLLTKLIERMTSMGMTVVGMLHTLYYFGVEKILMSHSLSIIFC